MNQLKIIADDMLPVYENGSGEKLVNARELHENLFISTRFNDWITRHINNYGFLENEDFYSFLSKTSGRPRTEYLLTMDTAKEIAMVQNNEQGRAVRRYFIRVEKEYRKKLQPQSIEDLIILQARSVKELKQKVDQQEKQIETITHRVDNFDKIDHLGDPQQRLNNMVRKYAAQNGIAFPEAWRHFRRAFNNAYRTNLKALIKNYQAKHGLKSLTAPQYLSLTDRLEDGMRVADKMLNQQTFLTTR